MNKIKEIFRLRIFFKVILPIIALIYIFYPSNIERLEKQLQKRQTLLFEMEVKNANNETFNLLSTFKNSWFVTIYGNNVLFALSNQYKDGTLKYINDVLNWNNKTDICIIHNNNIFWKTDMARDILKTKQNEIIAFVWTWQYVEPNGKFNLPQNVIIARNPQNKLLDSLEFEKYFWKVSNDDIWKRIISKIPYTSWNWVFLGYDFKNIAYASVELKKINTLNEINWEQWTWTHLIFSITKWKKKWNGLIINEYNNKALSLLTNIIHNSKNISIELLNIENENISSKKNTYWSDWFYSSKEDFIKNIISFWKKNNIMVKELKLENSQDNISILENENEYILVYFDKDDKLLSSKEDIKMKIAVSKQNYQIGEIIYFLDKNKFEKIDGENCDFKIRNGAILK